MTTAKDSPGRSTGRRFNMAAIKREIAAMQADRIAKGEARRAKQERGRQRRLDNPEPLQCWPR